MINLLPLGSVVLLKDATKRVMICGRMQTEQSTGKEFEYSGCLYPEGILNSDELILFNNEDVERLYYVGMQDEEEFAFKQYLNDLIDEREKKTEKE